MKGGKKMYFDGEEEKVEETPAAEGGEEAE